MRSGASPQVVHRVVRNTISNYAGKLVNLCGWFVLTPFILSHLGDTMYGLWVLVGSVVAYGSLFDFGISSAVVKYVAECHATGEIERAERLIATALTVYAILGLVLFAVTAAVAPVFPAFFNVPVEQQTTAVWLVLLSGFGLGLSIPSATAPAILRGLQRFDLVNLISVTGMLVYIVGVAGILLSGWGVIGLVLVSILVNLVTQVVFVGCIRRVAPGWRIGWSVNRQSVRTITSFSFPLFLLSINGYLETKTDEIVVGANLALSAVTPYNIARRLSALPQMLTEQFLALILPLASALHTTNDPLRLRLLYIVSTRLTLALFMPLAVIVFTWADAILGLWVGAEYVNSAPLVLVLTAASLIDTSQWPAGLILQGIARHKLLSVVSLASGITNLLLSLILVRTYGLMGVAVGTLVPTTIVCLGFVMPYTMRQLGVSLRVEFADVFFPALMPAIPMMLWLVIARRLADANSLLALLVAVASGLVIYALGFLAQRTTAFERGAILQATFDSIRYARAYVDNLR